MPTPAGPEKNGMNPAFKGAGAWSKVVARILASPAPEEVAASSGRASLIMGVVAAAVGGWILAYKVRDFLGLGTTSDLYQFVQLSTSWLHGSFLHDNSYGDHLAIHTYFLCPVLGILTIPFGAYGLFLALGLAAALTITGLWRLLRLLGVPFGLALGYAMVATLMPLSVHLYQDSIYGFHVELLEPCLAVWLAYFLLRRSWPGSMTMALLLIATKEDAPLLVVIVAAMVLTEDFIRNFGSGWRRLRSTPAATVLLLGVLAVPLLLLIINSQQTGATPGNLARLHPLGARESLSSYQALLEYMTANFGAWLRSAAVTSWLGIALPATFGLIVLRPHYVVLGLVTTLIAWLMQDLLFWAPRFAQALAFFQLTGALAFASVWRVGRDLPSRTWRGRLTRGAITLMVGMGVLLGEWKQWRTVPRAAEVYRASPHLEISAAERDRADRLFAHYREEGRQAEPVVASPYLFRYAHDRNLFWHERLRDRPKPVWILWDQQATPLATLELYLKTDVERTLADYELLGQAGRFLLYRAWAGREPGTPPAPTMFAGEPHGLVRLKVQPPAGRTGTTEPILSLGSAGRGDLFFVHYLDERHLVLGFDSVGLAVQRSRPVEYAPGRTYEVELFSGSLLPPVAAGTMPDVARLGFQNYVSIRWEGQEVLGTLAPPHAVSPNEVYAGRNVVRSGRAVAAFSGQITDLRRGGYPPPPAGGGFEEFGALQLVVQLPDEAAGIAEPLAVVGVAGEATLGYVRLLPEGKIIVGAEFWSIGKYESEPLSVDRSKPVAIICSFPVFYPPAGDPRWGAVAAAEQERLRSWLRISVNGAVVVDRPVAAPIPRQPTVVYGKNPAGGSVVAGEFMGRVLQATRQPLPAQ